MNITTRQVVLHFLGKLLKQLQKEKVHELDGFFNGFFTKEEIIAMLKSTYGNTVSEHVNIDSQDTSELLDFLSNADVLGYFIKAWQDEITQNKALHPIEVMKTLEQLGHPAHYLASKAIAFWDEYDHANYRVMLGKAGKVYTVYGIYDKAVKHEDVEQIDTPPKRFYETYDKAKAVMEELISNGTYTKDEIHVLPLLVGDA